MFQLELGRGRRLHIGSDSDAAALERLLSLLEHGRELCIRDGLEQICRVRPIGLDRLVGHVEPHPAELSMLSVQEQAERAFVASELREQGSVHLSHDAWCLGAWRHRNVLATLRAAPLLTNLRAGLDASRNEDEKFVLDVSEDLLVAAA